MLEGDEKKKFDEAIKKSTDAIIKFKKHTTKEVEALKIEEKTNLEFI